MSLRHCAPVVLVITLAACQRTAPPPAPSPAAVTTAAPAQADTVSDGDIADAYAYLLARLLVLRQQHEDFERGHFTWNTLVHRTPRGPAWTLPDPAMLHSEAWIAVDPQACVRLDVPAGQLPWNWQMVDGWGETIVDIDEQAFAKQGGTYAFCLRGAQADVPQGAARIDLPVRTARALLRVTAGDDATAARSTQHAFRLAPLGAIRTETPPPVRDFDPNALPRVEAFDDATRILDSAPDRNVAMAGNAAKVRAVAKSVATDAQARRRVDKVILSLAWPQLHDLASLGEERNGWWRPDPPDTWGGDAHQRTYANLLGIRPRAAREIGWGRRIDGDRPMTLTFPKGALPASGASLAWSIAVEDPNPGRRRDRDVITSHDTLDRAPDGTLVIALGPTLPRGVRPSNWLRTEAVGRSNLTLRLYRPTASARALVPPPLVMQP